MKNYHSIICSLVLLFLISCTNRERGVINISNQSHIAINYLYVVEKEMRLPSFHSHHSNPTFILNCDSSAKIDIRGKYQSEYIFQLEYCPFVFDSQNIDSLMFSMKNIHFINLTIEELEERNWQIVIPQN